MFSQSVQITLWAIALVFLLHAGWRADWKRLRNNSDSQILFASIVLLWLIWRVRTAIPGFDAMDFHLLMVTTVTLMFGRYFALFVVLVAELIYLADTQAGWELLPLDFVIKGLVPVLVTVGIFQLCVKFLPRHFFIYIYLSAFLAGAISILVSRVLMGAVMIYAGIYSYDQLEQYFALLPIMMFSEAFMNGAIMTIFVVFKPEWVSSFDDRQYLHNK